MEEIKNKLINHLGIAKVPYCQMECYLLAPRRYLIFWGEKVDKKNIYDILQMIDNYPKEEATQWKSLIFIAETDDEFKAGDLLFFDGMSTFAVFYLINKENFKIYKPAAFKRMFFAGIWKYKKAINYNEDIQKIDDIVRDDLLKYEK